MANDIDCRLVAETFYAHYSPPDIFVINSSDHYVTYHYLGEVDLV